MTFIISQCQQKYSCLVYISYLVAFLFALAKGTDERVCSGSQDEDIFYTSRKEWQQELKATGHIVSTVKKQREMKMNYQLTFSFLLIPGYVEWATYI